MFRRFMLIYLLLFLHAAVDLKGQPNKDGIPIITNYPHYITKGSEQNWCITQDNRGVIYVGNNNKGVLEYDGVEWRRIPVTNDPFIRSLVTGDNGVVYVGGVSEFGYLGPDLTGNQVYHSLSDTIDQEHYPFTDVWRTYSRKGKIYFCAYDWIFIYDTSLDTLSVLRTHLYTFFSFLIDDDIYISDFGSGMMRFDFEKDGFVTLPGGLFFKDKLITGLVKYDDHRLLAGTMDHGIFLFDLVTGKVDPSFADPALHDFFRNITYIRPLKDDFLISSLTEGLVVLTRGGKAQYIITEDQGLLDQSIPFVYANEKFRGSGPLWIANFMGVSKLEFDNPFRVFTETAGFKGLITDIQSFNNHLYISTFQGLYYKSSTSGGTRFTAVPGLEGEHIDHLHVIRPARNVEFLVATSETAAYLLDRKMHISILADLVVNPPDNLEDRGEYAGKFIVSHPKHSDIIYTGRSHVVGLQYQRGKWKEIMRIRGLPEDELQRKVIDKYGYLWSSTERSVVRLDIAHPNGTHIKYLQQENGLPADDKNHVFLDPESGEVLLGTKDDFFRYNYFRDTIYRDTFYNQVLPEGQNLIMAFHQDQEGDLWYSFENETGGWTELMVRPGEDSLQVIHDKVFQRLEQTSVDVFFSDPDGAVWFANSNKLYKFDKKFCRTDTLPFNTLIRKVTLDNDSVLFNGTHFEREAQPEIKYSNNNIGFTWAAPYFEQEEALLYSYRLERFTDKWSEWDPTPFKEFTNLPYGAYTLFVKSKNVYGDESVPASYSFIILRPWYAHFVAFIIYFLLAGLVIYISIKLYTRRLKQENLRLEGIIEERTAKIRKQKEELTDSIEYASRIQRALLPPYHLLDEHNIEHFILYRPRDIVSGDFYWIGSKNGKLLIVAADCTGHGVPGAFMSMLGMTFLDEIIIKSEITSTHEILDQLREHVITSLRQSGKRTTESTKDGMDLAMISIDLKSRRFQYSGAYNPLYLVRKLKRTERAKLAKGEELELPRGSIYNEQYLLLQIRADQMPIGISEIPVPFTSSTFRDEGYSIYMFSDGYLDQFGGPQGKKFMSKNFKKLILELQSVPLSEQGTAMEKVLTGWMGEISQIDDILVMGLRMKAT